MSRRNKTAIKWGLGMVVVQIAIIAARYSEGEASPLIQEGGILFTIAFWFAIGYGLGYFVGPKNKASK